MANTHTHWNLTDTELVAFARASAVMARHGDMLDVFADFAAGANPDPNDDRANELWGTLTPYCVADVFDVMRGVSVELDSAFKRYARIVVEIYGDDEDPTYARNMADRFEIGCNVPGCDCDICIATVRDDSCHHGRPLQHKCCDCSHEAQLLVPTVGPTPKPDGFSPDHRPGKSGYEFL